MKIDKKGSEVFSSLGKLGIGVVTLAIILIVGFMVISEGTTQIAQSDGVDKSIQNSTECWSSHGCNASRELNEALSDIPAWLPIVIITAIGMILIGMVVHMKAR